MPHWFIECCPPHDTVVSTKANVRSKDATAGRARLEATGVNTAAAHVDTMWCRDRDDLTARDTRQQAKEF